MIRGAVRLAGAAILVAVSGLACARAPAAAAGEAIEVVSVRLTAAGGLVDLRYRIVDPDRAAPIFRRGTSLHLVDDATGGRLAVPRTRIGPMRQAGFRPQPGRIYLALFRNPGVVRAGSRVTLEVGDLRVSGLRVE